MKTIGELLGNEEINASLVLALSGTIMMLVAKGHGPISLKGMVSGALSNPVPRREHVDGRGTGASLRAAHARIAA